MDGETDKVSAQDRESIKSVIVSLMISVPSSLQLQLSDAVTIVAENDFPAQWPQLVQVSCHFFSTNFF